MLTSFPNMGLTIAVRETVPGLWNRNRADCRPLGQIMSEARSGKLAGTRRLPDGSVLVDDVGAALAAMKRKGV